MASSGQFRTVRSIGRVSGYILGRGQIAISFSWRVVWLCNMSTTNDGYAARSLRGDLGGNTSQQLAQHRVLTRADQDMVDVVGLREFENGRCGIDCLKHMNGEALALQLQGLGPISQCYQTVDVLAVSLLVEGLVQCNSAKLEHIETSQACRRKRGKNALRRYAKLVVEGSWTL